MIVETQVIPYWRWLLTDCGDGQSALSHFFFAALVLLGLVSFISLLVTTFRHGPRRGVLIVGRALRDGVVDIFRMSPRRVYGLASLAYREAFRRFIWVTLVVFLVILMFAAWFLNPGADEPAKLYLGFVLSATTYLMLALALYLSSLSLPADIKNRTIHTIVTKPVRASEIVLGRVLGFSSACTVLLVIMGVSSYLFVERALAHTHQVVEKSVVPIRQNQQVVRYSGETTSDSGHHHHFSIPANAFAPGVELSAGKSQSELTVLRVTAAARARGVKPGDIVTAIDGQPVETADLATWQQRLLGQAGSTVKLSLRGGNGSATLTRDTAQVTTEMDRGHWHRVIARWADGKLKFEVGPAEGMFAARVPIYGDLRFRDRQGDPKNPKSWTFRQRGISVGKLFHYRSFIEGNTLAAAVWTFEGIHQADYPDGLPLDVTIRVYRSHKGNVEQGITGSLMVENPDYLEKRSREVIFTAKEFTLDRILIPRKLSDRQGKPLDLFRDLVTPDGRVQVWVRCVEGGQYFGVARADLYVRAADGSFALNFCKAFGEVWLQVVVVVSLAVLFSTFLSGPIAVLLTVTTILMGFCTNFIYQLTNSVIYRDVMTAIDAAKQIAGQSGSFPDADTIQRIVEMRKAAGVSPFDSIDLNKLHTALALKFDQVDVLERVYGGGPIEAFYRIITQRNLITDLDKGKATTVIQNMDMVLMHGMQYLLHVLPDFSRFGDTDYLAAGYNIRADLFFQHATVTLGFAIAAFVAGYFVIKYREMAR